MQKFRFAAQIIGTVTIALLAVYGAVMFLSASGFAGSAWAQEGKADPASPANDIPSSLNYQGFLREVDGSLTNGTYTITAKIYLTATGGSPLYSSQVTDVNVRDGLFNIVLEDLGNALDDVPRYIGISLDDGPELIPRQRLHAVPWAMTAKTLVSDAVVNGLTVNGTLLGDSVTADSVTADSLTADSVTAGSLQLSGQLTFTDRAPFKFFKQILNNDSYATYHRDGINADTGVLASEYTCAIVGFNAGQADLNENDGGWVLAAYAYAYPNPVTITSTWRIAAWLRDHNDHNDWSMRVMCVDNRLAEVGGGYRSFHPGQGWHD